MSKKKASKPIETKEKRSGLNYFEHNKKVAKLRGKAWKEKIKLKRFERDTSPTVLKSFRTVKYTQDDFHRKVGIKHKTTYARIEQGRQEATEKQAKNIASILDIPMGRMFLKVSGDKFDENRYLAI